MARTLAQACLLLGVLEARPARLLRLLTAQPAVSTALVASAVAEVVDNDTAAAGAGWRGVVAAVDEGAWLVALLDALLARLRRPDGHRPMASAEGRRAYQLRLLAAA